MGLRGAANSRPWPPYDNHRHRSLAPKTAVAPRPPEPQSFPPPPSPAPHCAPALHRVVGMQTLAPSPAMMAPATAGRQARPAAAARAARQAAVLPRPQRQRAARAAARQMVLAAAEGAQQLQSFATTEPQRVAGADGKLAVVSGVGGRIAGGALLQAVGQPSRFLLSTDPLSRLPHMSCCSFPRPAACMLCTTTPAPCTTWASPAG